MMRRLVVWGAMFLILWGLWWAAASAMMHQGALASLSALRGDGWQARAEVAQTGFPLKLRTVLSDVALADPAQGLAVSADMLTLHAPVYWPGFATVDLPETPIVMSLRGQEFRLQAADADVGLRLQPGPALTLQSATATSGKLLLSSTQGALFSASRLDLSFVESTGTATYELDVNATDLTPGDMLRSLLALPPDWPRAADPLVARLVVGFDRPLDRHALQGLLPQPRMLDLQNLDLHWGAVHLSGHGKLSIDAAGVPSGSLQLGLVGWQQVLDIAADAGLMDATLRNQAQMVMGGLANLGGGGPDLDLTLTFANGKMMLGPIELGPAPRILLR